MVGKFRHSEFGHSNEMAGFKNVGHSPSLVLTLAVNIKLLLTRFANF